MWYNVMNNDLDGTSNVLVQLKVHSKYDFVCQDFFSYHVPMCWEKYLMVVIPELRRSAVYIEITMPV